MPAVLQARRIALFALRPVASSSQRTPSVRSRRAIWNAASVAASVRGITQTSGGKVVAVLSAHANADATFTVEGLASGV